MVALILQAVDLTDALKGLPVAAAVAVAVLWTKVHRLEKDQPQAVVGRLEILSTKVNRLEKDQSQDAEVIGRLEVTLGKLETTLEGFRDVLQKVIRVDVFTGSEK